MDSLKKVQQIAQSYYSRKDVQKAIFEFCQNRETIPRYNMEAFGKRPDMLDYPSDVFNYTKKGATSFHCSEELWQDPLKISTDMTLEQYCEIRSGWDFLIDIDSKYLDYSKIAARLIIDFLKHNGVNNVGIKFSGSKGFHLIIPWKAFPKMVTETETKNMFPEWPRLIAAYINESIADKLTEKILSISDSEKLEERGDMFEVIYNPTGEQAQVQKISRYVCRNCRTEVLKTLNKQPKKTLRCHVCNYDMDKKEEREIYFAVSNEDNSQKNPNNFIRKKTAKNLIDSVDIILVASRHLFRAPYSLHEKTALASIVLEPEETENFNPLNAHHLKVIVKDFMPDCEEGEARELLLHALDWARRENKDIEKKKKFTGQSIDVKNLTIKEEMFPDCIKKILQGIKQDGRKRALFVLLAFFKSLEFPQDYIDEKIEEWNKKNYQPLKTGYIKSQESWFGKNKILPPNCDKPFYKSIGIRCTCQGVKNPINYTIREAMRAKGKTNKTSKTGKTGKFSNPGKFKKDIKNTKT